MTSHTEHLPDGTPLHWSGAGSGCVLLVHGVTMDQRMWAAQVDALAPEFRVCCMDMPGHGAAPPPPADCTLAHFVSALRGAVERCVERHGPPLLVGFSMGGLVAQALAVAGPPPLAGLVLMNTVHRRSPAQTAAVRARLGALRSEGMSASVHAARARWFSDAERREQAAVVEQIATWMLDGDCAAKTAAYGVFAGNDGPDAAALARIACPALVMTGAEDSGSTPEMARAMAAAIPGAGLVILEGQRHMMPVLDAGRVNQHLQAFARRCLGTERRA